MATPNDPIPGFTDRAALPWLVLLLLALLTYMVGLGGQNIPSNGDEMVYAHIAHQTALTQHWLPLASQLENMRNTKPPLLFWQAMVAGDWGQHWTLAALRLPSLLYTLAVCGLIVAATRLWTRSAAQALRAGCVYLAFFCTFRYGRPYLTSAAETFWFGLPMFWLLRQRLREAQVPQPGARQALLTHLLIGLAWGLGSAYKSFALIAPAAAAFWCATLASAPKFDSRLLLKTTALTALSVLLALGVFSLWFVLDPDPSAVWREFIVGENAAKLASGEGYWHTALRGGGSSIWAQLLAYVQNAGLLLFPVLGLMLLGLRGMWQRVAPDRNDTPALWISLAWLGVWLLAFTVPSQRSARYVIPAMPALALLLAAYWPRIARIWFGLTLPLAAIALLVLGRIAWSAHDLQLGGDAGFAVTVLVCAGGAVAIVAGAIKPAWTRACALLACLAVLACLDGALAPLDGPDGRYDGVSAQQLHDAQVAIPNGFNGSFERYQFLLPAGNRFVPYDVGARAASRHTGPVPGATARDELMALLNSHGAVAWEQSNQLEAQPPCLPDCTLLAARWYFKGRHEPGEITLANLWHPQVWLFRREWLLTRRAP
jgi:4-amino-4-deoxy-L-arabinose transferase-like glycosyltransferase